MNPDIPAAISPAVATQPRRVDIFVARVSAALGERWTSADRLKGREFSVVRMNAADRLTLINHFRAAGWTVALNVESATLLFHPSKA